MRNLIEQPRIGRGLGGIVVTACFEAIIAIARHGVSGENDDRGWGKPRSHNYARNRPPKLIWQYRESTAMLMRPIRPVEC